MVLGKAFGARPRGAVPNVTTFTELFAVAESSPESGFAILADPGPIIVEAVEQAEANFQRSVQKVLGGGNP